MSGMDASDVATPPVDRRTARRQRFVARPAAPLPFLVRYSTHLQIALPFFALFIVMAGLVWPLMDGEVVRMPVGRAPLTGDRTDYASLERPRLSGVDRADQPYSLAAERATQRGRDDTVIDLTAPRIELTARNGRRIEVWSDTGRFDRTESHMEFAGHVTARDARGNTVVAERLRVDPRAGSMVSDRPIRGDGPDGEVDAEGIEVRGHGERVIFTGRVRLLLRPGDEER
ncbi:MAG: LPS export ABC transporter periplasmic protein LptC [Alphaproteobacteria bacterium]|nr:LPS export ABC transporter periplasmic protein LptC [Alphaproteobacteria bacterium]MCW5740710.1 LPS export ABC transporter periplasmic protein LptC [Alphaproteobacteria bacterium]